MVSPRFRVRLRNRRLQLSPWDWRPNFVAQRQRLHGPDLEPPPWWPAGWLSASRFLFVWGRVLFDERFLESIFFFTKTSFFTKSRFFFFAFYWWYGKHLRMFCSLKKTSLLKRHACFLGVPCWISSVEYCVFCCFQLDVCPNFSSVFDMFFSQRYQQTPTHTHTHKTGEQETRWEHDMQQKRETIRSLATASLGGTPYEQLDLPFWWSQLRPSIFCQISRQSWSGKIANSWSTMEKKTLWKSRKHGKLFGYQPTIWSEAVCSCHGLLRSTHPNSTWQMPNFCNEPHTHGGFGRRGWN